MSLDRAAMGGASVVMLLADAEAPPKQASRFGLVGRLARERDPVRRKWPHQRTDEAEHGRSGPRLAKHTPDGTTVA